MISMFEQTREKLPGLERIAQPDVDERAAEAMGADISRPLRVPRRIVVGRILCVLLFGLMATTSGLARRLAYLVMLGVGNSYSRILLGMIVLSFMLTFLVPSGTACVVIMAAIAIGLLDAYGFGVGSNIGRGMFITLTYTAGMFDKMVIAGPASILGRDRKSTRLNSSHRCISY